MADTLGGCICSWLLLIFDIFFILPDDVSHVPVRQKITNPLIPQQACVIPMPTGNHYQARSCARLHWAGGVSRKTLVYKCSTRYVCVYGGISLPRTLHYERFLQSGNVKMNVPVCEAFLVMVSAWERESDHTPETNYTCHIISCLSIWGIFRGPIWGLGSWGLVMEYYFIVVFGI